MNNQNHPNECREAFEQEFRKQYGILPGNKLESFPEYHKAFAFYQAAWNHALKQRLAVKEEIQLVEIESHPIVIEDKVIFDKLVDIRMALSKAGCPFVKDGGELMSAVEQIEWLSTHPAPDDQQAKDAARFEFWFSKDRPTTDEFARLMVQQILGEYPALDDWRIAIDDALAATKQEEV